MSESLLEMAWAYGNSENSLTSLDTRDAVEEEYEENASRCAETCCKCSSAEDPLLGDSSYVEWHFISDYCVKSHP